MYVYIYIYNVYNIYIYVCILSIKVHVHVYTDSVYETPLNIVTSFSLEALPKVGKYTVDVAAFEVPSWAMAGA